MEPMEPGMWQTLVTWIFIYPLPFVAFGLGVYTSIRLDLNEGLSKGRVYLMSLPVGAITIGNFFVVSNPDDFLNGTVKFGSFLVLIGTLMLYGTAVPHLFTLLRSQHTDNPAPS